MDEGFDLLDDAQIMDELAKFAEEARRAAATAPEDQLELIKAKCAEFAASGARSLEESIILARAFASELSISVRDSEIQRFILGSLSGGVAAPRRQGERLDTTPTEWAWENILMAGKLNMLVAPPKAGKSALLVGLIGAWARGQGSFLGHAIHGDCPNVYIVGTDQPEGDWVTLFRREGLVGDDDVLADPIKLLWSAGAPLHLSVEGISHLKRLSEEDPGSLFLVDSYHACISPLGIDEATSAFDGPARALQEALAPSQGTIALIHHTNKSVSGGNATNASRGSNSLPAAGSMNTLLTWFRPPAEGQLQTDRKLILKSEGRGKGTSMVIELSDTGWTLHGDGDSALQAQALAEAEAELSGQQADVFDYAMTRWENGQNPITVTEVAGHMGKEAKKVDRVVRALVRKGLLRKAGELPPSLQGGRPAHLFSPWVMGGNTPSPENGGFRGETEENPSRASIKRGFPPKPHKPPIPGGGGFPPSVLPPADSPLELLTDGEWVNGWKLHYATRDEHQVIAYRLIAGKPIKRSALRWGLDVRLCQTPTLPAPLNLDDLPF